MPELSLNPVKSISNADAMYSLTRKGQTSNSGFIEIENTITINQKEIPICVAVTTTNITLSSATASYDGVTFINGDSILVNGQTTASENGVYIFNDTSTWNRHTIYVDDIKLVAVLATDSYPEPLFWKQKTYNVTVDVDNVNFEPMPVSDSSVNVEQINLNKTLNNADVKYQFLDPNVLDKTITLNVTDYVEDGKEFFIFNAANLTSAKKLIIATVNGTNQTVYPGQWLKVVYSEDSSVWLPANDTALNPLDLLLYGPGNQGGTKDIKFGIDNIGAGNNNVVFGRDNDLGNGGDNLIAGHDNIVLNGSNKVITLNSNNTASEDGQFLWREVTGDSYNEQSYNNAIIDTLQKDKWNTTPHFDHCGTVDFTATPTATELFLDFDDATPSKKIVLPASISAYAGTTVVIATMTDGTQVARYDIRFIVKTVGGVVSLPYNNRVNTYEDDATWDCFFQAGAGTLDFFIQNTGATAPKTVYWHAHTELIQIRI